MLRASAFSRELVRLTIHEAGGVPRAVAPPLQVQGCKVGAQGVSALETLISNFRTPNLGSLFSPSLTESSSIKAFQQTFNSPHIIPGPAHHGSPCSVLGFPCLHLCSLWPAQSSPVCLAVGYALEKKKNLAGIIIPCLISELKIASLHCGETRGQKSPEHHQFSLQQQKHLESLFNYFRSNGAI